MTLRSRIAESPLNPVLARFERNWPGYIRQYRVLLVLALLASLADMISTSYFMVSEGPQAEVHPVVRAVCLVLGPIMGPAVGKACQFAAVIALTVYFRRYAVYLFIPVIILYTWAAWYNVWGCNLYYPRLLWLLQAIGG